MVLVAIRLSHQCREAIPDRPPEGFRLVHQGVTLHPSPNVALASAIAVSSNSPFRRSANHVFPSLVVIFHAPITSLLIFPTSTILFIASSLVRGPRELHPGLSYWPHVRTAVSPLQCGTLLYHSPPVPNALLAHVVHAPQPLSWAVVIGIPLWSPLAISSLVHAGYTVSLLYHTAYSYSVFKVQSSDNPTGLLQAPNLLPCGLSAALEGIPYAPASCVQVGAVSRL